KVVTINSTGNVGIGTTNPSRSLEVAQSSASTQPPMLIRSKTQDATSAMGIGFVDSGNANNFSIGVLGDGSGMRLTSASDLIFITNINSTGIQTSGEKMRINSTGNVGIGSSNPSEKLEVNGNMYFSGNASTLYGSGDFYIRAATGGVLRLGSNNVNSQVVINNGKVGIGVTNPASPLSVGGVGNAGYGIYGTGSNTGVYGESANYAVQGYSAAGVAGYFSGAYGLIVTSTTYPGVQSAGPAGNYDFYANGAGVDYGTASSIRWKSNITPLTGALANIMKLEGISYDMNQEHGGGRQIGFIGEDIGKYYPEIVNFDASSTDPTYYITGMDYSKMTPVLLQGIKELNTIVINASSTFSNFITITNDNLLTASSSLSSLSTEVSSSTANIINLMNTNVASFGSQISSITNKLNLENGKANTMTFTTNGTVGIGNDGSSISGELLRVSGRVRATGFDVDNAADIAENFPASEAVDAGTVVAFSTTTVAWDSGTAISNQQVASSTNATSTVYQMSSVRKAVNGYEAVGVISTNSGIILGSSSYTNCSVSASSTSYNLQANTCPVGVPVAFSGRIPVKVTTENGEVKQGDYLTVSLTMPGYAMKLTGEGRSIGRALSDYEVGRDRVLMLVENGNQKLDFNGKNATTTGMLTSGNLDLNANGVAIYNIKSLASANGTWSIDENGRIVGQEIVVNKLCVGAVCITEGQFLNMVQQANPGVTFPNNSSSTPQGTVAGTSTSATSTDPVPPVVDPSATSTNPVTPPPTNPNPPVVDAPPVNPTPAI
ncbi:MAG: tail fiber domain-containing protein, partial [Candidatus Nomurabacteria bacterium]